MLWFAAYADFNIFHRRLRPELRCAVRQDRPVPGFLDGAVWAFGGTAVGERPPPGFHSADAHAATQKAGYYLFRAPTPQNLLRVPSLERRGRYPRLGLEQPRGTLNVLP